MGVDVSPLEMTEFGDAQARGIERGQDGAMFEVLGGQQEPLHFIAREDDGEGLGLFGIGNLLDHPGPFQGGLIEKAERTDRLDTEARRDLLLQQVELIGTDVLRAEVRG